MKKLQLLSAIAALPLLLKADYIDSAPYLERDRLLGEWGGSRLALEDNGITAFLYYDAIIGTILSGGIEDSSEFTGQVYAGFDFDLEKLFNFSNTTMKVSMVERHGDSISSEVGGVFDPMTIYGGPNGQETILYQIAIDTQINDQWSFKFGRDSQDSDFANNDLYRFSLSTAINGPIRSMMLDNIQIVSFPLGVWHARLKYEPNENHKFQIGVYQNNENIWDNIPGTDFTFNSGDGATLMAQYDWMSDNNGQPIHAYVGIAHSMVDYTDFNGDEEDSLSRIYGHIDIEISEGLTLFAFGAFTDQEDLASMPLQISLGANYKGILPSRPDDYGIFNFTYGKLSDDFGASLGRDLDYEAVYEVGYRYRVTPATYIQPSLQYIQNTGGDGEIDDTIVLGVWIGASF